MGVPMNKLLVYVLFFLIFNVSSSRAEFAIVPIKDVIDGGLAAFVDRSLKEAEEENKRGIIFHIDTPGGRVDSAVHIKDAILRAEIPTIAFVDKNAISAGALISLACDSLYMSTGASIGAATAVDLQGKKASEKVISYFRAQMRATAEANGRRADIAEAMVDEELEIEGITEKGMLVTLTYKEALELEISDGTVENIEGLLSFIGHEGAEVDEYRLNWAEYVVRFLTHPIVSSLLMSIGFLGLLVEIRTPGWGIGGTIGLIALALFFGSHYIVELAGIGELLLFALGIILLALEVLVIPGFGIAGISGIALIILSLYLSLVGTMPNPQDFMNAIYTVGWSILITIIAGYLIIRIFPRTSIFQKLTLAEVESSQEGYTSVDTFLDLVGAKGIALNNLRPVGKAEINGSRLDVVTEGDYIEKDTPVIVTEVRGSRIIVREIERT
ncbi:MAG TPA: nodulation protein NfeD [bacterium]|nr:nodulation protein NfeD [bacterium]